MKANTGRLIISIMILLLFSISVNALESLPNKLESILKLPDAGDKVYPLTIQYIVDAPIDSIPKNRELLISALSKSNISYKNALIYEVAAHSAKNLLILKQAKFYAQKGINEPKIPEKLLIRFLTLLATIETGLENYLVAIENYQVIEKILIQKPNNSRELALNSMGLGQLYLKAGLYKESINALNKGIQVIRQKKIKNMDRMLYKKKAIVYFYLQKPDSLQYYTDKALIGNTEWGDDSISFHRLRYMKLMLEKNPAAVDEVRKVINSPKDDDELMSGFHLAQAFAEFNQPERAKKFIFTMLETGDLKNLHFLTSQLYRLLIDIYLNEGDHKSALFYYKKNVEQLSLYARKQSNSENLNTILKYHEIKDRYVKIEEDLNVRKNYLLLSIIIGLMSILTLFLLYRAVLIKKKFNELAYSKLNDEIATINSHDVRKHLSNILGIIHVIQISDNKQSTYLEMEDSLLNSAEDLDSSIKNISMKLDKSRD